MGQYDNLTPDEKRFLERLGQAYLDTRVESWMLLRTLGTPARLFPLTGPKQEHGGLLLDSVPGSVGFYRGLEVKGFVVFTETAGGSQQITVQQPTLDYLAYRRRPRLMRLAADVRFDLLHERTLLAKAMWIVLGYALGFVSAILLRLLGWVKIGN